MLASGLSHIAFIMLRYILSIPRFIRTFIMKWYWILLKTSSAYVEMIRWFLSLLLLMCCMDFCMLNNPYTPGVKPTWSWWMIFLICGWIQFPIILLNIFASIFIIDWI
jgi:hypothetical protein